MRGPKARGPLSFLPPLYARLDVPNRVHLITYLSLAYTYAIVPYHVHIRVAWKGSSSSARPETETRTAAPRPTCVTGQHHKSCFLFGFVFLKASPEKRFKKDKRNFCSRRPPSLSASSHARRLGESEEGGSLHQVLGVAGDAAVVRQGQVAEVGGEVVELAVGQGVGRLEQVPKGGGGDGGRMRTCGNVRGLRLRTRAHRRA